MKIKRPIIISLILITRLTSGQDLSLKDLNLKDKVKSITEISYVGKLTTNGYVKAQRGWESKWQMDSKTQFDSNGNKINKTFYDSDSQITQVDQFVFTSGRLMKSEMLYHTRTYQYDSSGRLISMKEINRQPSQISASNVNIPGKESESMYKFIYDENDRLSEKHELDSKGIKVGITRFKYDKNGRLIKEESINNNSKEWHEYSYDSNGNLKEKTWSDSDEGTLEKVTYIYENNIMASELWENYDDGELEGKILYTYEKGNEKEVIETDELGNIDATWSYQYQYDSKGNWTEQVAIIDEEEVYIIEREIEYY